MNNYNDLSQATSGDLDSDIELGTGDLYRESRRLLQVFHIWLQKNIDRQIHPGHAAAVIASGTQTTKDMVKDILSDFGLTDEDADKVAETQKKLTSSQLELFFGKHMMFNPQGFISDYANEYIGLAVIADDLDKESEETDDIKLRSVLLGADFYRDYLSREINRNSRFSEIRSLPFSQEQVQEWCIAKIKDKTALNRLDDIIKQFHELALQSTLDRRAVLSLCEEADVLVRNIRPEDE